MNLEQHTETLVHQVKLVKGEFSPSQAAHVVKSLINEKINFHKMERIRNWEANHQCDEETYKNRVKELEKELEEVDAFFSKIQQSSVRLGIDGKLKIEVLNK